MMTFYNYVIQSTDKKLLHFNLSKSGRILRVDNTCFPRPGHILLILQSINHVSHKSHNIMKYFSNKHFYSRAQNINFEDGHDQSFIRNSITLHIVSGSH